MTKEAFESVVTLLGLKQWGRIYMSSPRYDHCWFLNCINPTTRAYRTENEYTWLCEECIEKYKADSFLTVHHPHWKRFL